MKIRNLTLIAALACLLAGMAAAQTTPPATSLTKGAKSADEAAAIGYMNTAIRAENLYKKKHDNYAKSLKDLVASGSFTRRMTKTDRGVYIVGYSSNGETYSISLTPKMFDEQHRAFYADEDGTIRVDPEHPANAQSPPLFPGRRSATAKK
jgi:competence protein ComGC